MYSRELEGRTLTFGHAGWMYNERFLLYDRETDSLWYPREEGFTAIQGELAGKVLENIPLRYTNWYHWLEQHPDTSVTR